jgi:nicotinate-nucleotide pyrophosphorylase (carboxylating)
MQNDSLPYLSDSALNHFIEEALQEDIGSGDVSSLSSVPAGMVSKAELKIKDSGILAGVELAKRIFSCFDPGLHMEIFIQDGSRVEPGQIAFSVEGSARSILSTERLVLNCMQRMSGVATRTRHLQEMISHTKARVLDTRKTSPNSRIIEKWAVAIGGGSNHRFALYDMVMLKDNHIDYAGGLTAALKACRQYLEENKLDLRVEVETRNLLEFREALSTEMADVIMLDNYPLDQMEEAVRIANGKVVLEACGNIREETIVKVAETGVDFISVGALTHSYRSLDLSLKAVKK